MDMLYYLFALFLVIAGVRDMQNRKVEDLLTSFLWVIAAAFGMFHTQFFTMVVLSFAVWYAYNSVLGAFARKYVIGWADILILPLFFAFLDSLGGYILLIAGYVASVLVSFVYLKVFKKGVPYVMIMALIFMVALLYLRL